MAGNPRQLASLALAALAVLASGAYAADITSCGETVAAGETGVLQAAQRTFDVPPTDLLLTRDR
jgi:hypothetical protein